jgi:hypothetical protein
MNPHQINWLAVLAAALSTFVLGGLWYSPILFGKVWLRANGFTETEMKNCGKTRAFAMFLSDAKTTVIWGMTAGALAGLGWVAAGVAIIALFERRSWSYILVNCGYLAVTFLLMGAIIGAWR